MQKQINEQIKKIGKAFKEQRLTLATAESCTAGGLSYHISKVPECSSILERGFITYSNKSKGELVGVSLTILQTHGAVSAETAKEMAEGALAKSGAQISVSITGLAGEDEDQHSGDSKGIVWIACACLQKKTQISFKQINGKRHEFTDHAILEALKKLFQFVS